MGVYWSVPRYTSSHPIMKRHVLIFGLVGGLLIATLQYTEYRFVIIEHSVELYSALVATLFATFGIWLGLRITRSRETIRETVVVREVRTAAPWKDLPPVKKGRPRSGQTTGVHLEVQVGRIGVAEPGCHLTVRCIPLVQALLPPP